MKKMKHLSFIVCLWCCCQLVQAIDLTQATIVYHPKDHPLVLHMAKVLALSLIHI